MNTTKTSVAVTKGATASIDLDKTEQAAGGLWALCLLGLAPTLIFGLRWIRVTWPVGLPTTALAVYMSKDAIKRREEIERQFILEQNEEKA